MKEKESGTKDVKFDLTEVHKIYKDHQKILRFETRSSRSGLGMKMSMGLAETCMPIKP